MDERLEAEGEVAVARLSIDSGDLRHAAAHLGNALTAAPQLPDAYEALAELAVAAGGPVAALELFSADEPYIGTVACIAHLHAAAGHWDSALPALASVIGADPERPWAEAAWLADPDLPGRVPPDAVTQAVAVLVRTLPDPLPPQLREGVGPFYALVRACVGAHPGHSLLHTVGSTLARRFGDSSVAVAWAERARDLDGNAVSLAGLRGHVVVLNVWGSWCGPCRAEADDLEQLSRRTRSEGVRFLGINTRDRDPAAARSFVRAHSLSFPSLPDPTGELLLRFPPALLNPQAVPATLVIDRRGRIAASIGGAVTEEQLRPVLAHVAQEES
ncbi:TlpA disulfide reductase family protein [Streptomyces sp. NPDC001193]